MIVDSSSVVIFISLLLWKVESFGNKFGCSSVLRGATSRASGSLFVATTTPTNNALSDSKSIAKQKLPSSQKKGGPRTQRKSPKSTPPHKASKQASLAEIRTWRLSNINVPLDEDPGKDSHSLHDGLLARLSSVVRYNFTQQGLPADVNITVVRKSFDGRWKKSKQPAFTYTVDMVGSSTASTFRKLYPQGNRIELVNEVFKLTEQQPLLPPMTLPTNGDHTKQRIVIVGAGPAGLFAALRLVEEGFKPIIVERGKPVELRGQSIGALFNRKILDPESNLCYGEGGAGTWSDGKLTTRIGKNSHEVRYVLESLVRFGAPERILIDGKPHLGTDRLVRILKNLREYLTAQGAEFRFDSKVEQFDVSGRSVTGVKLSGEGNNVNIAADAVILAVGHSARQLYEHMQDLGVVLQPKPIAAGFRIEHPQELINNMQYGPFGQLCQQGVGPVPVADYRLAMQSEDGRGIYSFCMCPGGQIVPTSVSASELCLNGMSFSKRQSKWANSALVVSISPEDMAADCGKEMHPLIGVDWQRAMEQKAAILGGGNLVAPVQRATDFMAGTVGTVDSTVKPIISSYRMGVKEAACHTLYPEFMNVALRQALVAFDKTLPGFLCDDAILHGIETRTSAPVQVSRHATTCESISLSGLFPAGEGAGYAGGIVSAAVDGGRVAAAVIASVKGITSANDLSESKEKTKGVGFMY